MLGMPSGVAGTERVVALTLKLSSKLGGDPRRDPGGKSPWECCWMRGEAEMATLSLAPLNSSEGFVTVLRSLLTARLSVPRGAEN